MGYMQTSFTWSILFFTNVCKKINCFKVFRLPGAWTWDTKGWHTILWAYIKFLELACSSMSLHAVPWACMQFHDLVCSCRLRLSSSQEFRSACLGKIRGSRGGFRTYYSIFDRGQQIIQSFGVILLQKATKCETSRIIAAPCLACGIFCLAVMGLKMLPLSPRQCRWLRAPWVWGTCRAPQWTSPPGPRHSDSAHWRRGIPW